MPLSMSDYDRAKALALGWLPPEEVTLLVEGALARWRDRYERDTAILRAQIAAMLPGVPPGA